MMKWQWRDYQRIASARLEGNQLVVLFEDGSCARVDAQRVLPADTRAPDWASMMVDPYEIVVPTIDDAVEIPWSTIRVLTDRDYSAHLAAAAEEQAKHIGRRIQELRENRGLGRAELAEQAAITSHSLSRIEAGRPDAVFTDLQRVLAALDCSLRDLAV